MGGHAAAEGFSVIEAFMRFANMGAEWVMWLMIALAFGLVVLALERARLYARTRSDAPDLARRLVHLLDEGRLVEARDLMKRGLGMEERVLADALEAYERGPAVVEQILASSLARERQRFDRFLHDESLQYPDLFREMHVSDDGTLGPGPLIRNLAAANPPDAEAFLHQGLYELIYVHLYDAKDVLAPDEEREMMDRIAAYEEELHRR